MNGMMDGSNNWGVDRVNGVVDSMMGSHWDRVSSVVGNDGGGVNSVVSHWVDRGLVYRLRVCLSLVSDISNKPILMVSVVGNNLHSAVRKLNSVLSLDNAVLILSFSLGKVSSILISAPILVSEWFRRHFFLVIGG